eukprot:NODE_22_length_38364_cov_0.248661.p11 type:complete len:371 gc:universal NODE_22_length_38364_cov_0.248661:23465-22353(-)
MNLDITHVSRDIALVLITVLFGANMHNFSKISKAIAMLIVLVVPYFHVYATMGNNYFGAILNWIVVVKCYKSFNINFKNYSSNVMYAIKDLRMKQYDPHKKYEIENNFKYLSSPAEVIPLLVKYTLFLISLLVVGQKHSNDLNLNRINLLTGWYYCLFRFIYAFYYGILISTAIQLFTLISSLIFILVSKLCFKLSILIPEKTLNSLLLEIAYEVGDQRPYMLFNKPFMVKSVASFWSESWHTILRDIFILVPKNVYKGSTKVAKSMFALSAFIVSGVFHDYLILVCSYQICTSSLTYFVIQGIAVLIEYFVFSIVNKHSSFGKVFGLLFGNFVLTFACPYFVEPVKNIKLFRECYSILIDLPLSLLLNK